MKGVPAGIKVISVFFILIIIFPFLDNAFFSGMKQDGLHMSREEKVKIIQDSMYKNLNITTVEEFDKYVAKQTYKIEFNEGKLALSGVIMLVLLFGMWQLQGWVRIGMVLYTIYNFSQVCFDMRSYSLHRVATIADILDEILILVVCICSVIYLTSPKIKEYFKQSQIGGNVTPEDASEYIVPILWKQVLGLVILEAAFFAVYHIRALFFVFLGLATFIDTWQSGIYKKSNVKSILNMSPIGWSFVVSCLFIIGYPIYLINRNKLKTKENNNIFFYAVIILGILLIFAGLQYVIIHSHKLGHT